MKIPDWLKENHAYLLSNLHHVDILKEYTINHDCGKHLVRVEENGKIHYPGHAEASYEYYKECNPSNLIVQELILNDMFMHTCTKDDLQNTAFCNKTMYSLVLSSLAEIHANASIFGGIDSTSFKIKYKQLDRRGKALCQHLTRPDTDYGHSYVFVRNNLTTAQIAVQSGHALIELCQKHNFKHHPSLVYVVVKSEFKLKQVMRHLIDNGIDFAIFREPDQGNEITAIATEPLTDKRKLLEKYQLYK